MWIRSREAISSRGLYGRILTEIILMDQSLLAFHVVFEKLLCYIILFIYSILHYDICLNWLIVGFNMTLFARVLGLQGFR